MYVAIGAIVLCLILTIFVVSSIIKNPLSQILNYPSKIQERVETLPQYKDILPAAKKRISSAK